MIGLYATGRRGDWPYIRAMKHQAEFESLGIEEVRKRVTLGPKPAPEFDWNDQESTLSAAGA